MNHTVNEVLQFVSENDVKFIRLVFCDIFGTMKNIAIMATELPRAFERGVSFDVSSIKGFNGIGEPDLYLHPDPATMAILPWRPQQGRVIRFFCDIKYADGRVFDYSVRNVLVNAVAQAAKMGYVCKVGSECEFYLFERDEKGRATKIPHDYAGYLDVAPLDKGENVRRDICLTLEEMGTMVQSSHHESGNGQNEIDFAYTDALTAADDLITFKSVVRTIASLNGLFASFMPKPCEDQSGSGYHINMSLAKNGSNIFVNDKHTHSSEAESFIAGILSRIPEITVFLNPLTNSYHRIGTFEAPKYISWSHYNCFPLIHIPDATGEHARMELRSADPACNPYLAFALLLYAGLEGIEQGLPLCEPTDINLLTADEETLKKFIQIPENLGDAICAAERSAFVHRVLPENLLNAYLTEKKAEWEAYTQVLDKGEFEQQRYFANV